MKNKETQYFIGRIAADGAALCIVLFVISLLTTFDFSDWDGIMAFQQKFRPVQMLTVLPSILLAIGYVVWVSMLHSMAQESHKAWTQLALSFGLLYAGISIANYFIQLITVIPSMQNGVIEGMTPLVSGYTNSIFYALMASYFLMCISLFFAAFAFENKSKLQKTARVSLLGSGLAIPLFLLGSVLEIMPVTLLGALSWIAGSAIGLICSARIFRNQQKQA